MNTTFENATANDGAVLGGILAAKYGGREIIKVEWAGGGWNITWK